MLAILLLVDLIFVLKDPKWIEADEVEFISYVPPAIRLSLLTESNVHPDKNELQEWLERASFIQNDLKWLLCQSHSHFWNQVLY